MGQQSRTESLLEAIANQCVGMSYAVALYYFVFGFPVWQGAATTAVFALCGLLRVYVIRRVFEWYDRRKNG